MIFYRKIKIEFMTSNNTTEAHAMKQKDINLLFHVKIVEKLI